jgi:hypothetical protein
VDFQLLKDPRWYTRDIVAMRKDRPKAGIPLATVSTLAILRKNRALFSLMGAESVAQVPEGVGIDVPSKLPRRRKDDFPVNPVVEDTVIENPARMHFRCDGFEANHFSDITFHYYCLVPPLYRACHRLLVGKASLLKDSPVAATGDREWATKTCLKDPAKWSAEEKALDDTQQAAATAHYFKAFYASQVDPATGVNMFDYIMQAQTFAFDYDMQQAVLNEFYGELAPGGKWDPDDAKICQRWRPARRVDVEDGTHCRPEAKKRKALYSIGR